MSTTANKILKTSAILSLTGALSLCVFGGYKCAATAEVQERHQKNLEARFNHVISADNYISAEETAKGLELLGYKGFTNPDTRMVISSGDYYNGREFTFQQDDRNPNLIWVSPSVVENYLKKIGK